MENPEEILHSLEEFSKVKPKDIPRELEEYLCFVAKTGNPVYQWPIVKSLFREKLLSVITEFYESCPSVDIPPCPNVEMFNYDLMKNFILEKLDTFAAAPFTVQRICELLTTPRKEYNRIDKYMRALEKNILVVSTTEPGRRSTENGDGIMNGIESEHLPESSNSSHDINVEEMDESPTWPRTAQVAPVLFETTENEHQVATEIQQIPVQGNFKNGAETKIEVPSSSTANSTQPQLPEQQETVITCRSIDETPYVSIEPILLNACVTAHQETAEENQADSSVTITAVPAGVQRRRKSIEAADSSEPVSTEPEEVEPKISEEKLPQKEEDVVESKDEISSTVVCPEPIEEPATETKIVMHSEESALVVQEELGIENISPENSSSSPEALQIDISSDQDKNLPEKVEKVDVCPEVQQEEEKKSESTKWAEEEKDPLLLEENDAPEDLADDLKDQDIDGIPLDQVADIENEDLSENTILSENGDLKVLAEESVDKTSVPEERDKVEDEPLVETPTIELEIKPGREETPMEVDVISEPEPKKPEEPAADEPSSTSDVTL